MRAAFFCALVLSAGTALAQEASGRIEAIYSEVAPGVFVAGGAPRSAQGRRWADVEVNGRKVLARLPDALQVGPGDRVALRLADRKSSPLAQALPTTTVSRAVGSDPNASVGR